MSKPVKSLIIKSYQEKFAGLTGAVLVDVRGVNAHDNNRMRAGLAEKQIKVTVIKNSLAMRAFDNSELAPLNDLLQGPAAMVYPVSEDTSVVSIARELITWAKQIEHLDFKGALMEGISFGPDQLDALSKHPTKDEAQAQVVQLLLSPAQNLLGQIVNPGRTVASLVDAIREKLEDGREIKKAG